MRPVAQKLFATWWGIAFGIAMVSFIFNQDDPDNWASLVGAIIYLGLLLTSLYEIKQKETIFMTLWKRRQKRRQEEAEYARRWNH